MTKTIEPNKARQGRSGWQVLVVLISALVLVAIVWWGVSLYGGAIEPDNADDMVGGAPQEQTGDETVPALAPATD